MSPDRHQSHNHRIYGLRCDDYDQLIARAAGACEICHREWDEARLITPEIDHDHKVGFNGVRGLICPICNSLVRDVESGAKPITAAVRGYFADAWFRTGGAERFEYWEARSRHPGWEALCQRRIATARRASRTRLLRRLGREQATPTTD